MRSTVRSDSPWVRMVRCTCPTRRRDASGRFRTGQMKRAARCASVRRGVAGRGLCDGGGSAARQCPRRRRPTVDSRPPGQRLYGRHCLSCHQADGGGVPNLQPPIAGGSWVKGDPRALALFVMTGGFDSRLAQGQRRRQCHARVPPAQRRRSRRDPELYPRAIRWWRVTPSARPSRRRPRHPVEIGMSPFISRDRDARSGRSFP